MSLFNSFSTNEDLEKTGVVYTPDSSTAITLARAGGSNVKFQKLLTSLSKPYKRQIANGTLDPETDKKLMREAYAKAVVLNWETLIGEGDDARLVQGLEVWPGYSGDLTEDGLIPFTPDMVLKMFQLLPELFSEVMATAGDYATFRSEERKKDAGN